MARRRLLLFAFPAVMLVGVVVAWLLWPRTAITRENAAKIQKGMTLAEVEAILGGPARDDSGGAITEDKADTAQDIVHPRIGVEPRRPLSANEWVSDEVLVRIDFGGRSRVERSDYVLVRRRYESALDRLRRWLRL